MSETEGDNILNSLKNYSSNFSSIPTRKEILSIDTETFLQNGGSKNQIKGIRYLSENNEESDNNLNSENLSEMYGGKKNKPSPSDQYHQESINYLKDDLQLSPLEARAYKSLAYRYIKENNSTSTSLEKSKLMLALVKSENFLNEFKDKLDETMKIIESIDSEKEKKLLSEQNNTKKEEEKEEEKKTKKKQKGGSESRLYIGQKVIYHRRKGTINDIIVSSGDDTLYTIVFDNGPEVMLPESEIIAVDDKERITKEVQKLTRELDTLSESSSDAARLAARQASEGRAVSVPRAASPEVSPESLAALIGLQSFPVKSTLKYPSESVHKFIHNVDGKKSFRVNDWMTIFIAENNFGINLANPRIEEEEGNSLDGFSQQVIRTFTIVKTLNNNNTSLIHAYLFAISKAYKNLLLDDDRQTCVNVFIEKILKKIYLNEFKTEDKFTLLNNVISINLLLLKNLEAKKIINFPSGAVMTIYFDGRNYKVCILKTVKKFFFPFASLKLF
jgi:FtsZ-interacting cell division protein YlmF